MGCTSSKILMRSASLKEEFQKRLRRGRTESYDEILISTNRTEQFVAVLCSSVPNAVASNKFQNHESSEKTATPGEESESKDTLFAEKTVEEKQEPENKIETINIWDLLAGLEDDNEAESEVKEESFKTTNPIETDSKTCQVSMDAEKANEGSEAKGLKRKIMAKELARMKVPAAFEFSRTGSLRDWLSQGGQVFSPGSYVTPRFGSFEPSAANGSGEEKKENFFDPNMVLQLEEAMEEMTMEEEKILRQIVN